MAEMSSKGDETPRATGGTLPGAGRRATTDLQSAAHALSVREIPAAVLDQEIIRSFV